jgi:hypothetical protein
LLQIYGVDGRIILEKNIAANNAITISKSELKNGIFFYSISDKTNTERLKSGKVIFN